MEKIILSAFADEASSSVSGQIKAMTANGISMLEARGIDGKNISEIGRDKAKEVRELLEAEGLSVWSIGSPVGKSKISDPFEKEKERFLRVLDNAVTMNASCIRLFSFFEVSTKDERDEVMYRLSEFVRLSSGSNVVLCHENEKGIYGYNTENCLDVHKSVAGLKAVFDPANFIQCGVNVKEAWDALKGYVHYMHAKDALEDGSVVPVGHGIGYWEVIAPEYAEMGGKVISLEPHLRVFEGLSNLQDEELSFKYSYKSADEAFKAATDALRVILKK